MMDCASLSVMIASDAALYICADRIKREPSFRCTYTRPPGDSNICSPDTRATWRKKHTHTHSARQPARTFLNCRRNLAIPEEGSFMCDANIWSTAERQVADGTSASFMRFPLFISAASYDNAPNGNAPRTTTAHRMAPDKIRS